jgi:hypothetical protein
MKGKLTLFARKDALLTENKESEAPPLGDKAGIPQ